MKHPWLSLAARPDSVRSTVHIPHAIKSFASSPELRRLALAVAARELDDRELVTVRRPFHEIERDCNGLIGSVAAKLAHYFEDVEIDGSGTIDWTELVSAALSSEAALAAPPRNQQERSVFDDACWRSFDLLSQGTGSVTGSLLAHQLLHAKMASDGALAGIPALAGGPSGGTGGSFDEAAVYGAFGHQRMFELYRMALPSSLQLTLSSLTKTSSWQRSVQTVASLEQQPEETTPVVRKPSEDAGEGEPQPPAIAHLGILPDEDDEEVEEEDDKAEEEEGTSAADDEEQQSSASTAWEEAEANRRAALEAERVAREEVQHQTKEEQDRKAKEEEEAKDEVARRARAFRQTKEESEKKRQEEVRKAKGNEQPSGRVAEVTPQEGSQDVNHSKRGAKDLFEKAGPSVRADRECTLAVVDKNGNALEFAVDHLKADQEDLQSVLRTYDVRFVESLQGDAFPFAADSLKTNNEFLLAAAKTGNARRSISQKLQDFQPQHRVQNLLRSKLYQEKS